ncbi:MAG: LysE family transporter [Methanotrichaceae archaeon]|nr:LysE family transporter [Methanotrichaceae archaeon]
MINEIFDMLAMAFLIGLTGALAPGPTLVATVNSSLKTGWTAGPKIALGHAMVELLIFVLIVLGLAAAAQQQQEFSRYIAIVGGLALIAFGILTVKGSRNASLLSTTERRAENPYLAGILTSAANPYFWVWWLSVGSALVIDGLRGGLILACLFMIGHWGADFGWYTLVSTSLDRGKKILSEANYQRILAICGCFLIFFGLYYLTRA